jgi:hypothetical protein
MKNTRHFGVRRRIGRIADGRVGSSMLALVIICLVAAPAVRGQVLQQAPSDAFVVIKIKNLQEVSGKVAQLSQAWGLANMRPELNDPLGSVLGLTGLGQGLNKNGEAGVVIMPPTGKREPDIMILVPVSDYKAFTASLPGAGAEGDLQTFKPGEGGPTIYASSWGKYAALSNQKELLAQKGNGVQAPSVISKELASKDIVAYVNLKPVKQHALDAIRQNKPMILDQIERGMAQAQGVDPKFAPVMKAYIGQFISAAETFLTDAEGVSFGLNLGKDGITTSLVAEFTPGSYLGKTVAAMKGGDESFTAGLPDGKYFVYGGLRFGPGGQQVFADFLKPIEAEIAKLGDDGKAIQGYVDSVKAYFAATKQSNFGLVAPPAAQIGQQGIIQMVNVAKGDTTKMLEAMKQMLNTQQEFMKVMGTGNMMSLNYTPNAKNVEGVRLDMAQLKINGQAATPQEQQMVMMMNMLYGPGGTTTYAGKIDDQTLIMTTGVPDEILTKAVQAAKSNADPLKQGPAGKVTAALPQNKVAAFYLQVDTIAQTILDFMAARGMPAGVPIPPNLPPLAGAVATEGSALRVDGYIPSQTVQTMIAAGMQLYLKQMPGGQPGGL